jgi:uncharacterized protein YprB with RNaseH-like and TPR domain
MWETGRKNGLSQRKFARYLGLPFDAMHGRLYREQVRQKELVREDILEHKTYEPVLLQSAVFDIETTDFHAGGVHEHLICVVCLPLGSDEPEIMKIEFEDQRDDRRLLEQVSTWLNTYDILVGHNIASFDLPWINSRLDYHGMPRLDKRFLYYDTYQASRRETIKADRKSLAFLADFFRIKNNKTSIYPVAWHMIDSPNEKEFREAREEIISHCIGDVKNNREIFNALWARDRSMTNLPVYKK